MTPAVVLDTSAGVEVGLWTEQGSHLASHALQAEEIAVPDRFHLDASALRRIELRGEVSPTKAQTALDQLLDLRIRSRFPDTTRRGTCDTTSRWPTRST